MKVIAVHSSDKVFISKASQEKVELKKDYGVEGDRHGGKLVQHIYDKKKNPDKPNLRQVHLIHSELFQELKSDFDFDILPGQMGENITTEGIDLLNLPENSILKIGVSAQLKITGLRMPCSQLDGIQKGLMKAVMPKNEKGDLELKPGVFGVVIQNGPVKSNDLIELVLPQKPYSKLKAV